VVNPVEEGFRDHLHAPRTQALGRPCDGYRHVDAEAEPFRGHKHGHSSQSNFTLTVIDRVADAGDCPQLAPDAGS